MWIPLMIRADVLKPLIVGSGPVALQKLKSLSAMGAVCTVLSPEPPEPVWDDGPGPIWQQGLYDRQALEGHRLVVAATGDPELNARICADAEAQGLWGLNASDGGAGDCILPMTGGIPPVQVTVSTGGASPTAAKLILEEIEEGLRIRNWSQRTELLKELREWLKENEQDPGKRRQTLIALAQQPLEVLMQRRTAYADQNRHPRQPAGDGSDGMGGQNPGTGGSGT